MNKNAFYKGFLKAAVDAKVVPSPSLDELQRSLAGINDSIKQVGPSVGNTIGNSLLDRMNTAVAGGSGALMGAGLGGSLGYWLGKDEEEKKDNRGMTALLGALAGGGLGLAGGAMLAPQIAKTGSHDLWPELGQSALAYGLPGAAVGGALGYMTGRSDKPEKDHGVRNALFGAAAGGLGAGYYGANQQFNNIRDTEVATQQGELDAAKKHWSHGLLSLVPRYRELEANRQQEVDAFKQYTLPKIVWKQVTGK